MAINERKVAEMAAFFLLQAPNRSMPHLKLMKLLYLSDRRSFEEHGFSMSGDRMVSMEHGPVLSTTLNLISGKIPSSHNGWNSLISELKDNQVSLIADVTVDDLLEFSRADKEIMNSIWEQFGHMSQWEIRNYTHDKCPEWQNPGDSSFPIELDALFAALGFSREESEELQREAEVRESIDNFFAGR